MVHFSLGKENMKKLFYTLLATLIILFCLFIAFIHNDYIGCVLLSLASVFPWIILKKINSECQDGN
jgi:hypothetical protein